MQAAAAAMQQQQQQQQQNNTPTQVNGTNNNYHNNSNRGTPQQHQPSTTSSPQQPHTTANGGAATRCEYNANCAQCQENRVRTQPPPTPTHHPKLQSRVLRIEWLLSAKDAELSRSRCTLSQVQQLAASLLDSCSDFDKLSMLHSKKVFQQIQSILAQVSE
jgi:hypothetical protein